MASPAALARRQCEQIDSLKEKIDSLTARLDAARPDERVAAELAPFELPDEIKEAHALIQQIHHLVRAQNQAINHIGNRIEAALAHTTKPTAEAPAEPDGDAKSKKAPR